VIIRYNGLDVKVQVTKAPQSQAEPGRFIVQTVDFFNHPVEEFSFWLYELLCDTLHKDEKFNELVWQAHKEG